MLINKNMYILYLKRSAFILHWRPSFLKVKIEPLLVVHFCKLLVCCSPELIDQKTNIKHFLAIFRGPVENDGHFGRLLEFMKTLRDDYRGLLVCYSIRISGVMLRNSVCCELIQGYN